MALMFLLFVFLIFIALIVLFVVPPQRLGARFVRSGASSEGHAGTLCSGGRAQRRRSDSAPASES